MIGAPAAEAEQKNFSHHINRIEHALSRIGDGWLNIQFGQEIQAEKAILSNEGAYLDTVPKSGGFAIAKDGERFSAFCGVGGAKWGEGRGEVHRLSI